jgi:hypothetical protein
MPLEPERLRWSLLLAMLHILDHHIGVTHQHIVEGLTGQTSAHRGKA